jgi:hypothetical protein
MYLMMQIVQATNWERNRTDRNKQDIKCNQRGLKPANCDARLREGHADSLIPTSTVSVGYVTSSSAGLCILHPWLYARALHVSAAGASDEKERRTRNQPRYGAPQSCIRDGSVDGTLQSARALCLWGCDAVGRAQAWRWRADGFSAYKLYGKI